MTIKQKMTRLILVSALMLSPFSASYGVDWEGRPGSWNIIDCRGGSVCGETCEPYRTTWQSVKCFFYIL
jgi:hypothetical protein